jgi:hypothetical protein
MKSFGPFGDLFPALFFGSCPKEIMQLLFFSKWGIASYCYV